MFKARSARCGIVAKDSSASIHDIAAIAGAWSIDDTLRKVISSIASLKAIRLCGLVV